MTASIPLAPLVSVVMAVKNGEKLMREAVDSILNQTFKDFEFIIINDGSTDNTLEILSEYQDPRIQVYSQENEGLARSLNRGVCLSTGKYIARQDHDDISLPTRLQKQVEYLEAHPECGLLGTAAEIWSPKGPTGRYHRHPTSNPLLKFELIFNNPFVHTSWMFRSDIVPQVGYYTIDPQREPPEDYEYASRIASKFDVANLSEVLVIYREIPNSLSSEIRPNQEAKIQTFKAKLAIISTENISFLNQINHDDMHASDFGSLLHGNEATFSGKSSFYQLEKLIHGSARTISKNYGLKLGKALVKKKIESLRHQYLISKKVSKCEKLKLTFSAGGLLHVLRLIKNRTFKRIYERLFGPGPRREKYKKKIKKILTIK
jgi:glycosyltransferase involved in cell wall biosynthesis